MMYYKLYINKHKIRIHEKNIQRCEKNRLRKNVNKSLRIESKKPFTKKLQTRTKDIDFRT